MARINRRGLIMYCSSLFASLAVKQIRSPLFGTVRLLSIVSIGSLQTVLRRLEIKGYLLSKFGEATKIRGGKRKRYFFITSFGKKVLIEVKEHRLDLWNAI